MGFGGFSSMPELVDKVNLFVALAANNSPCEGVPGYWQRGKSKQTQ